MSLKSDNMKSLGIEDRVDELKVELMERELENELLRHQCKSLEAEIRKIHASTSWRVTAPMRAVSRALRAKPKSARASVSSEFDGILDESIASTLPERIPSEDSFILYRIIGNDLVPRHKKGQSLENIKFIIEHEPNLEGCEKRFVLNRILDEEQEKKIVNLLEEHGCVYARIPFVPEEYKAIGLDMSISSESERLASEMLASLDGLGKARLTMAAYRLKNNYVMNVNGARNFALAEGRFQAKWVLPWDGNCFLTERAWSAIRSDIGKAPQNKYFAVPMARMLSNKPLVNEGRIPEAVEEPQLIFRADAAEQFNPSFFYGHRDKVELLWRLGVEGAWNEYIDDPWDQERPPLSAEASLVGRAGWVARLYSGRPELEANTDHAKLHRGLARSMAVIATLRRIDSDLNVMEIEPGQNN